MRWRFACSFIACIFIVFSVASPLPSSRGQVPNPSEADWAWLSENFRNALDHSIPLEKGTGVLISCRSYESLQVGEPEYSLSISERPGRPNANLFAHVRIPEGKPIGGQLLAFHHESPEGSVAEAEKNLKFKDWDLTDEQCPALRTAVQKLTKVRFEFSWPDKIFIDPRVHEFHFDSYSTSADFSIDDPGHPLVQWASETRHAIQACGADNLPSNKPVGSSKK
jgi:hypothetical protein